MNELLLNRLLRCLSLKRILNIIKSSLSLILSIILKKPIVWGLPPILTIEPINICNLKCPLCIRGINKLNRDIGTMSVATFKKIMAKLGDDLFFILIYHQGEPYLNKNFFEFVRLAKEKKIYVTTSTNGHYFTKENIQETMNSGLDSMIVSVDGTTQESYEKYRVGGKLDKVVEGTKQLIKAKKHLKSLIPNVALQFLVMKHNESEISEMQKLTKEIGADRLLIKNIEVHSLNEAKKWLPSNEAFSRYDYDGQNLIVKGADKKYCSRPWLQTLINWDGTFSPCCFDKTAKYPMGNIHDSKNISDIWKSTDFQKFRTILLKNRKDIDICNNCNQGFGSFMPNKLWKKMRDKN